MPARHPRLLYAHRGAAVELPENTLPAFRRAAEIGVDAIETDVHLTADGHVLVSHDPSALRMTGVGVAWRDLTLDQARALDVGWGFVDRAGQRPHLGRGIRVCTLEEALRELPHLRFNVDLKVHTPSPVPTVLALLRRLGAEERVTLASFHARTLLEVRRRGYAGETALAQAEVAALLALPEMVVRNLPFLASAAQLPTHAGPLRFDRPRGSRAVTGSACGSTSGRSTSRPRPVASSRWAPMASCPTIRRRSRRCFAPWPRPFPERAATRPPLRRAPSHSVLAASVLQPWEIASLRKAGVGGVEIPTPRDRQGLVMPAVSLAAPKVLRQFPAVRVSPVNLSGAADALES